MAYLHHLRRLYNTPLLVEPSALDAMLARLTKVLIDPAPRVQAPEAPSSFPTAPYAVVGQTAVIPVHGVLVQRGRYDAAESTVFLGYHQIVDAAAAAADDSAIRATVLDIDSPGGEVGGAFEAMRALRALTDRQPIYAVVNEHCCSSAYGIASACGYIATPSTGQCGSVGVIMRHADMSKLLEKEGIAITELVSGAQKADGSAYRPLGADVRARFQAAIDSVYDEFIALVAEFRGMSQNEVRTTEAAIFQGVDAVQAGFADEINTLAGTLESTMPYIPETVPSSEVDPPVESPPEPVAAQEPAPISAKDVQAARLDGAQAERERIRGILEHPEAQDRQKLAEQLAFYTELSAEAAAPILAAAEKEGGQGLYSAMQSVGDSGVDSIRPVRTTMPRGEFEQLSSRERADFVRNGGKIQDAAVGA